MRALAAAEVMALDHAGEAAALADPDHVHLVLGLELIDQHLVARLQIARAWVAGLAETKLPDELRARHSGLLQVPCRGLVNPRRLDELEQTELHRVIAVGGRRLPLDHHARPRFEQSDRHDLAIGPKNLSHPDLFSKNSWTHN